MIRPLITVITCTYNSEKYLSECIESVKNQSYGNIQHIFIDGGSRDNTIRIINSYYPNPLIYYRKAGGIYDALNYGIIVAGGDVVGFLHSDDIFFDNNCLERIANSFSTKHAIAYYCSRMYIYDENLKNHFATLGANPHKQTFKDQLYSTTYFAHPTYYCSKKYINKVGDYNPAYKIAADIDWLIRLEKFDLPYHYDSHPLIKFRAAGCSSRKYFLALKEEFVIRKKYQGLSIGLMIIYMYHFLRRLIRYMLNFFGFNNIINYSRKLLMKFFNEPHF